MPFVFGSAFCEIAFHCCSPCSWWLRSSSSVSIIFSRKAYSCCRCDSERSLTIVPLVESAVYCWESLNCTGGKRPLDVIGTGVFKDQLAAVHIQLLNKAQPQLLKNVAICYHTVGALLERPARTELLNEVGWARSWGDHSTTFWHLSRSKQSRVVITALCVNSPVITRWQPDKKPRSRVSWEIQAVQGEGWEEALLWSGQGLGAWWVGAAVVLLKHGQTEGGPGGGRREGEEGWCSRKGYLVSMNVVRYRQ